MRSVAGWLVLSLGALLVGLFAGVLALFTLSPQGQCAVDAACALAGDRWWHFPTILLATFGPLLAVLVTWWRLERRARQMRRDEAAAATASVD